jgi:hypothetical protein
MDCEFDLYEMFPDHSIQWRSCVRGTQHALEALQEIAQQTDNECFATDLGTDEIIARVNEGPHILDDAGSSAN